MRLIPLLRLDGKYEAESQAKKQSWHFHTSILYT